MEKIPFIYSKGEGQGFRVIVTNRNAGIEVDRFFRANQKQEAINFAKQIAKTIEEKTKNFLTRKQLGERLGISPLTIESYKTKNNEIYKKIQELFDIKKGSITSPELYKPKNNKAIEEIKKLVDITNKKPKETYRGQPTGVSLIKQILNESETPLNVRQIREKLPKVSYDTINTTLAELKKNENFKDKISIVTPQEVAAATSQTKAIKRTPMMNVLRDVFVLDPDADSVDIAKAIYGDKKFNNASQIQKYEYIKDAAKQVPKFVAQFSEGAKIITPGFKSIKPDKLGDILDSIESRISDFGQFEPSIRRNLQLAIADAKRGLPEGATRIARTKLLQRGMAVDEVGAVAATFDKAPGYLEATQVIEFLKNKEKGKKLDLKFSRALSKAIDGDFSDVKDYNELAKDFGKKYKIDVPIFLTGKNLKPEEHIKYFDEFSEGAQKNIKEIAKENNFVIKTKSKPLFSLAGIPFQGKGKYAFLGLAAPFIANATPYQGGNQQTSIQDQQTALQDQTVEAQPEKTMEQEVAEITTPKLYFDKEMMSFMTNPDTYADQSDKLYWLADNPIAEYPLATVGTLTAGLAIPGAKETYQSSRSAGRGPLRSATGVALKGLQRAFTPLPVAAIEAAELGSKIAKDESLTEDLTSPTTYLNLAFLEGLPGKQIASTSPSFLGKAKDFFTLKNVAAEAEPGIMSAALRMGLNPRVIAGASRFLGIPGLIASSAYTAYDMYNQYKENKEREQLGLPND